MTPHPHPAGHSLPLRYALPLTLALVASNACFDHFGAPSGIFLTPVVIVLAVWLISFCHGQAPMTKTLLSVTLISLNDLGIKLWGGGMHDLEGRGFVSLFLFVGAVPAFLILTAGISRDKQRQKTAKRAAILLFPVLLLLHLCLTNDLGMGECINCY